MRISAQSLRWLGARLALAAVLLFVAGPLFSQWLLAERDSAAEQGHCHEVDERTPRQNQPLVQNDGPLWAKCGYCTLLFSCPALPGQLALLSGDNLLISPFLTPKAAGIGSESPIFPGARSRAPPVVC